MEVLMTISEEHAPKLPGDLWKRMQRVEPRRPGESAEEWEDRCIKELFGPDAEYECNRCGTRIHHWGVCDSCMAKWEQDTGQVDPATWLFEHGVPRAMSRCTWFSWKETNNSKLGRSLQELKQWKGQPSLVVMAGPPGVGKTHCAVATMAKWYSKGRRSQQLLTEAELVLRVKEGMGAHTDSDVLRRMQNTGLLVLDDLGRSTSTDWGVQMVVNNLVHRIDNGRPTIITTNLTHEEVRTKLDERLASRMWTALAISFKSTHDFRKGGKP